LRENRKNRQHQNQNREKNIFVFSHLVSTCLAFRIPDYSAVSSHYSALVFAYRFSRASDKNDGLALRIQNFTFIISRNSSDVAVAAYIA
jgi:hypothetical protein